jgi:hypothetical protein
VVSNAVGDTVAQCGRSHFVHSGITKSWKVRRDSNGVICQVASRFCLHRPTAIFTGSEGQLEIIVSVNVQTV